MADYDIADLQEQLGKMLAKVHYYCGKGPLAQYIDS